MLNCCTERGALAYASIRQSGGINCSRRGASGCQQGEERVLAWCKLVLELFLPFLSFFFLSKRNRGWMGVRKFG